MQQLLNFDHWLFSLINQSWTHPALDFFFVNWTDFHKTPYFLFAVLPLTLVLSIWACRWNGFLFVVFTAAVIGLCDGFFGKIVKPLVGRLRPPLAGLQIEVIVRAPHFGGSSFPSIHAANMFCLATFVSFYFPRLRWVLFLMALLTAYSRVYCGVHFPTDVVGGAFLGSAFGWGFAIAIRPLWTHLNNTKARKDF